MKLFAKIMLAALLGAAASVSFSADAPAAKPAAAEAPPKAAKPDPAKGDTIFNATPANSQSCASCHNADGNSAIAANPKLAQQHPEYIYRQLQDFKSGKRKSAIMKPLASALSDEDMRNIAWFVASKKIKPGFSKEKDLVGLGERIFRGGVADRQIPACAGCHSPNGAGIPAQYPRLGGQHADYTAQQLNLFREGGRLNSPVMTGVAAKLSNKEITAVSDYIAGLR
ncbi:c-type cytochrome [Variovorax sp. J22P168]|uniref:c-type cytochrome n=1 Tax=Variovorax jilinensis TaxID=3053513 RepID=UPI002576BB6E|nr:c-type cytochrome [Variovorax sp. J22P168]MDM0011381.1 c-type cytochrome [Variovorax sp. J22P168]